MTASKTKKSVGARAYKKLREQARAQCCDEGWLRERCRADGDCLIWEGPIREMFGCELLLARRRFCGVIGSIGAHRAMWIATRGRDVRHGRLLRRTCDNFRCIAPTHLIETNRTLESARKALGYHP
jgi:hypothetical protein